MKSPKTIHYCENCDGIIQEVMAADVVHLATGSCVRNPGADPIWLDGFYCNLSCAIGGLRLKENRK